MSGYIKTWLPVFTGFRDAFFVDEKSIYYLFKGRFKVNDFKSIDVPNKEDYVYYLCDFFDSESYENAVASKCCSIISKKLACVEDIKLEVVNEDGIDCEVKVNLAFLRKLVYDNRKLFEVYLKETYSQYPGFIPFYSNSFDDWKESTEDFKSYDKHELGAVLNFICNIEGITMEYLAEEVNVDLSQFFDVNEFIEFLEEEEISFEYIYHNSNQLELPYV